MIKDFEQQVLDWHVEMVEAFKQRVMEHANETLEAWKNGVNKFISRHADLMMVDNYVGWHNANREELEKFINDAYSLDRI